MSTLRNIRAFVGRTLRRMGLRSPPAPQGTVQLKMLFDFATKAIPDVPCDAQLVSSLGNEFEQEWLHLLNSGNEFGQFGVEQLTKEIRAYLLPGGAVFGLVDGELVATASACQMGAHQPWATLMYVVVKPEFRGRNYGAAVSVEALRAARRAGFRGVMLQTDDVRLPAIRMYQKLGFEPYGTADPAVLARWSRVLDALDPMPKRAGVTCPPALC